MIPATTAAFLVDILGNLESAIESTYNITAINKKMN
jgi:hypothetical protein